jgi:hypothetical protein
MFDFHAFSNAPNLEELEILYSESPCWGRNKRFPNLKKVHVTYSSKYPLSLSKISPRTIETLLIGGEIEISGRVMVMCPSLSTLEFTKRVPTGISLMVAPNLRHLILRNANLYCLAASGGHSQHADPDLKNREVLGMLGSRFQTVEVLEIHEDLHSLVSDMVAKTVFTGLRELWILSKDGRKRMDLV